MGRSAAPVFSVLEHGVGTAAVLQEGLSVSERVCNLRPASREEHSGCSGYCGSTTRAACLRAQVKAQLAALQRKAAYRKVKRASSPAAAAAPVECEGPPPGPAHAQHRTSAEELHKAATWHSAPWGGHAADAATHSRHNDDRHTMAAAEAAAEAALHSHMHPRQDPPSLWDNGRRVSTAAAADGPGSGIIDISGNNGKGGGGGAKRSRHSAENLRAQQASLKAAADVCSSASVRDGGSGGQGATCEALAEQLQAHADDQDNGSGGLADDELSYSGSGRIRSQLAGLRRKQRLR